MVNDHFGREDIGVDNYDKTDVPTLNSRPKI